MVWLLSRSLTSKLRFSLVDDDDDDDHDDDDDDDDEDDDNHISLTGFKASNHHSLLSCHPIAGVMMQQKKGQWAIFQQSLYHLHKC